MIHYHTETDPQWDHYGVSVDSYWKTVLVQIQEQGDQARIPLTVLEARHMAQLLLTAADQLDKK